MPKYPNVTVKLVGQDGNIFNLLAIVNRAMTKAGISGAERDAFNKAVTSTKSYDEALGEILQWVEVK
jgi:hypothetical protein